MSYTTCGRQGHIADNCFRNIGYPPWWEERTKGKSSTRSISASGTSDQRATQPNAISNMRNKTSESAKAHHVVTSAGNYGLRSSDFFPSANVVLTDAYRVGISGLSDQQWKNLVQMLNERNATSHDRLSGKFFLNHGYLIEEHQII